jgi:CxxC-x17-CxxC domain-containing protein
MYPAVCSKCGNACEVPFRPDGQRPVSCKNCFVNTTPEDRGARFERSEQSYESPKQAFRAPIAPMTAQKPDPRIEDIQRNIAKIQAQLERIIVSIATLKPKRQSSEE